MTSISRLASALVLTLAGAVPLSALAQAAPGMTEAVVKKVDKAQGKVTLKHGEIKNLDMPPMTMVFVVKDKSLLDKVKAGDAVQFKAVDDAGKFTVTDLLPAGAK